MNQLPLQSLLWTLSTTIALQAQNSPVDQIPEMPGPFRVQKAAELPEWLRLSGVQRTRYEGIEGQFRANPGLADSDHLVFLRTNIRLEADLNEDLTLGTELMDSRQLFGGTRSQINTSNVNPLDFLQAYAKLRLGEHDEHTVTAGRRTLDLGSRRLVARNRYRNTINAFTGLDYHFDDGEGNQLHAFWYLPVNRRPSNRTDLLDNDLELDDQDLDQMFFGTHAQTRIDERTTAEAYGYILLDDRGGMRDRELYTVGARVRRKPERESFDHELEGAVQLGESQAAASGPQLDHVAWFFHASAGYTFDASWEPRVRLALDVASGDRNPGDGSNNRFDTLFGARRFEYGPTGIYGPIARSNLISPEVRFAFRPADDVSAFIAHRSIWLQSDTDAAPAGGVRDASGVTGNYVGQQLEARVRFDIVPDSFRLEFGTAYLFDGDLLEDAPNARGGDTFYAYVQSVFWF